eukprot:gb/GECG01008061.1/.p1 GENE.gb/GECG01008061.1/~~gb/GECG01008061.1/.p1  ORF type:complete len:368 (+),score=20.23 gb/GECG01008061.1/:1-1104(+)
MRRCVWICLFIIWPFVSCASMENREPRRSSEVSVQVSEDISVAGTNTTTMSDTTYKFPSFFISHGAGPSFFLDGKEFPKFSEVDKHSDAAEFLRDFRRTQLDSLPRAILVISAHWETPSDRPIEVTSAEKPELVYDYYGFPSSTYAPHLTYECRGSPQLANRVKELIETGFVSSGPVQVELNPKRGLDHGVFVPLKLMFPDANIPVVQLSLCASLKPSLHLKIGAMLAPLREENVLILGSGQATHALTELGDPLRAIPKWASEFGEWLRTTVTQNPELWAKYLLEWEKAPHARRAHPREEHFIPLLVAAAAADPYAVRKLGEFSKEGNSAKVAPTQAISPRKSHLNASTIHDGHALQSMLMTSFRFD